MSGAGSFSWVGSGTGSWNNPDDWTLTSTDQIQNSTTPGVFDFVTFSSQEVVAIIDSGTAADITVLGTVMIEGVLTTGVLSIGSTSSLDLANAGTITPTTTSISESTLTDADSSPISIPDDTSLSSPTLSISFGGSVRANSLVLLGSGSATVDVDSQSMLEIGNIGHSETGYLTVDPGFTISGQGLLVGNILDDGTIIGADLTFGRPVIYAGGHGASSYFGTDFTGDLSGTGTVEVLNGGTTTVEDPVISSDLTFELDGAATLEIEASISAGNSIDLIGNSNTLIIDNQNYVQEHPAEIYGGEPSFTGVGPVISAAIIGFNSSDSLIFVDDFQTGSTLASVMYNNGLLILREGNSTVSGALMSGAYPNGAFSVSAPTPSSIFPGQTQQAITLQQEPANRETSGQDAIAVPCFAAGTLITCERGSKPVERLRIGDDVLTITGKLQPIQWIGKRRLDCRRHAQPRWVNPVYILPHAFGEGRPNRLLKLSPSHSVFMDNTMIPIKFLINGVTIYQVESAVITYYHVELARHDVILAEGLPTETYLETGGRYAFESEGSIIDLHPNFERQEALSGLLWRDFAYAPMVSTETQIDEIYKRLLLQAVMLGHGKVLSALAPTVKTLARPRRLRVGYVPSGRSERRKCGA